MVLQGGQPHQRGANGKSSTVQEKVGTFYYTLGLFCITYPICVLISATTVIIISWLPLVNLPFPGRAPQIHTDVINATENIDGSVPFCYIQQVVMRVTVLPWEQDLMLGDAFRGPLYEVFKVLEVVRNYQDEESIKNLGHVCLHIETAKKALNERSNVLPQYSCLVLSPANLWNQDIQQFLQDSSILGTVFNHHSFQKGKTSISEMLFGMHLIDTGIKRYPIRNRQRIIQFAITLFFKQYDQQFVSGLRKKLTTLYPLHQNESKNSMIDFNKAIIIQYPGEIKVWELVPLCVAFILIFIYYYFSVRKIEMIKSKLGMAFTATFTIFCTLTMTTGICFFFGLTLNYDGGKGVFPYLALLVGLENVLVLTKSVLSTPLHLDVKIRNAQGVSKEGWSITKNLFVEITVLTFGLFTFVPAIQEFCIFSIVALITDFFLQMFFYLTILGVDITRKANSIDNTSQSFRNGLYQYQSYHSDRSPINVKGINRSRSHPRLSSFPSNVVVAQTQGQEKKIPKRVRLVNVWARTRFFQRSFMLLMIIWISMIAYKSDLINHYILNIVLNDTTNDTKEADQKKFSSSFNMAPLIQPSVNYVTYNPLEIEFQSNYTQGLEKLKHPENSLWLRLSPRHWSAILKKYNISLSSQSIAVLPNIKLSHVIRPEQAVLLRNPNEKYSSKFQWQALAMALDPIDFKDEESIVVPTSEQPFYPTSPMEILLTTILCLISVIVLAYAVVVLYRCICSRNYAEWRASWHSEKVEEDKEEQVLLEAVPVVIEGHQQQIECLATDGKKIVSTCLGGQLKIWDQNTGQLLLHIDRKSHFTDSKPPDQNFEFDDALSDYESGSPPSRDESFPRLLNKINTDFSYNTGDTANSPSDSKYDFNKSYRYFYFNHNYDVRLRHKCEEKRNSFTEHSTKRHSLKSKEEDFGDNAKVISFNREFSDCYRVDYGLSPVWCMDYLNNLIVIGCAGGRLEFWEGTTGKLKCIFEDENESGITNLKLIGAKLVAVRLCGNLELFQLQTYNQGQPIDWNFTYTYRRMHVRTGSVGSISNKDIADTTECTVNDDLRCIKLYSIRAHQQPITCLDCEGNRIVTGSQDHTLKVFRLEDASAVYTLHGHCGPITCLFIDRLSPSLSGSGSQDGMLCVWDLMTGACVYSIQAHDGSITSLTYSASYVISVGMDERLCVWERFQGHLLNTINISQMFSNQVLMLAQHLVVTGRSGGLVIWDVRTGECVRTITLGRSPFVFINQLLLLRDAVLCDYGKQLSIVRFPLISHKFD